MRFRARSTSITVAITRWPTFKTSAGFFTKLSLIWLTWTRPSWCTPMSTRVPYRVGREAGRSCAPANSTRMHSRARVPGPSAVIRRSLGPTHQFRPLDLRRHCEPLLCQFVTNFPEIPMISRDPCTASSRGSPISIPSGSSAARWWRCGIRRCLRGAPGNGSRGRS